MKKLTILTILLMIILNGCSGFGFNKRLIVDTKSDNDHMRFKKKIDSTIFHIIFSGSENSLSKDFITDYYLNKEEGYYYIFIGSSQTNLDELPFKADKIYEEKIDGKNYVVYKYYFNRYFGRRQYAKLYIQNGKVVKMDIFYFTG